MHRDRPAIRNHRGAWRRACLAAVIAGELAACAAPTPHSTTPQLAPFAEVGLASWYGNRHAGRKTASGEPFDPGALTAAHRTLPLGALVRVTNLGNRRTVEVRINDRGPFDTSRIIDLSKHAAEVLGFTDDGTTRVRIELIRSSQ